MKYGGCIETFFCDVMLWGLIHIDVLEECMWATPSIFRV
jgi:hypothetical protein